MLRCILMPCQKATFVEYPDTYRRLAILLPKLSKFCITESVRSLRFIYQFQGHVCFENNTSLSIVTMLQQRSLN